MAFLDSRIEIAGESASRSKQAAFPFVRELTGDLIFAAAGKLWRELHATDASRAANPNSSALKITHIGLAFTGLGIAEAGQRGIETFLTNLVAADPGESTTNRKRSRADDDESDAPSLSHNFEEQDLQTETIFHECKKCQTRIPVTIQPGDDEPTRNDRIQAVRQEHDDFHFAQSLAKEHTVLLGRKSETSTSGSGKREPPKKKKRKMNEGIAAFFTKK